MNEVIHLQVASVEDALVKPDDYEVSHNFLGWQLSYIGGNCSTVISTKEAASVIRVQVKERKKFLSEKPVTT